MLNFFKRKSDDTQTATNESTPATPVRALSPVPSGKSTLPPEPAPLPEVKEGNLDSDWALWEDSVAFQDSQMPSNFGPLDSVRDRTQAKKDHAEDPFASVRKRGR